MITLIDHLTQYYRQWESSKSYGMLGEYFKAEEGRVFSPSAIAWVECALRKAIDSGIIDTKKPFLDAGSGDGRVLALASILGLDAYGLELDEELFDDAETHLETLAAALDIARPRNARASFTDYGSYPGLGLSFEQVGTFFHYFNHPQNEQLIAMIVDRSPKGTLFIQSADVHQYDGLEQLHVTCAEERLKYLASPQLLMPITVYRKI